MDGHTLGDVNLSSRKQKTIYSSFMHRQWLSIDNFKQEAVPHRYAAGKKNKNKKKNEYL